VRSPCGFAGYRSSSATASFSLILEEIVECAPLGFARLFPGQINKTIDFLVQAGAAEE
jgi:hypothetical protein